VKGVRRIGLGATVASGLCLVALGLSGMAGVDSRLEAASQARPEVRDVSNFSERRDCPQKRHRLERLDRDSL